MKKKLLALLLTFLLIVCMIPVSAYAEETCEHNWTKYGNNQPNTNGYAWCSVCTEKCHYPGNGTAYTHEFEVVITNCTNAWGTRTCKRCGITAGGSQSAYFTAKVNHEFVSGQCISCTTKDPNYVEPCKIHTWNANGDHYICRVCQAKCYHTTYTEKLGNCLESTNYQNYCNTCTYSWVGKANDKTDHTLEGTNKVCTVCGTTVITQCATCVNFDSNYNCTVCGTPCPHTGSKHTVYGDCTDSDSYDSEVCDACGKVTVFEAHNRTEHHPIDGVCTDCGRSVTICSVHPSWDSVEGRCTVCGTLCDHNQGNELIYPDHFCDKDAPSGQYINERCKICHKSSNSIALTSGKHYYDNHYKCYGCGEYCEHENAVDDKNYATAVICPDCAKELVAAQTHITPEAPAVIEDCTADTVCEREGCEFVLDYGNRNHVPQGDDGNCTTAVTCMFCEYVYIEALADHTPKADDDNCATPVMCANHNCAQIVVAAKEHTLGEDDGDCTTPILCGNEGCKVPQTIAERNHKPQQDDDDCTTPVTCDNDDCEVILTPAKDHVPAEEDDGDCTTAVPCADCGKNAVEKFGDHLAPVPTNDCTKDVVCDREGCDHVIKKGNAKHIPGADDGDCTAAVMCSVDGCEQVATPAKAHVEEELKAVAPTCTETGLTAGKKCSVCGKITVAQTVVAANGHTEVVDEAVAATCTEAGLTEGKHCSVCKEVLVKQEVVAANGHTEEVIPAVAPTCEEAGLAEGTKCSVCDVILREQEVVAATGHAWDEGKITTPATDKKDGVKTYTCKNDATHTKTEAVKYVTPVVDKDYDDVPKTGDNTAMILTTMTGIALFCSVAYIFSKKKIAC